MISQNSIKDDISNLVRRSYLLSKKYLIPSKYKMGKDFFMILRNLEESQWWSEDQLISFQWDHIKGLLDSAYNNAPYYRKLFTENNIHPEDIKTFSDFETIPSLTKKDFKYNKAKLLSHNYPRYKLVNRHTTGTTGSPLNFLEEKQTAVKERAFYWRFWNSFGYNINDKCAILRANNRTKNHRYNPYHNYLEIACKELSEKSLTSFLLELIKFKPAFIQAYPSFIYLLAKHLNQSNMNGNFDFIKVIFCASEKLFTFQRNEVTKAFNCKVKDSYGHSERAVLIHECEVDESLHIIPEYGYTELIGLSGKVIKEPDKVGEIVTTGFNNYAFPFIRYRTGDFAILAKGSCSCGRNFPVIKEIQGRFGDYIISPSGKMISPTIIECSFTIQNVREWQLVQKDKNIFEVLIVKENNYNPESELMLRKGLEDIIEENISIKIIYTDNIKKPYNMKHRLVISNINK